MMTTELTLFYDGQCPFCAAEMGRLKRWDHARRLAFVDVSLADFKLEQMGVDGVDMAALDRELHSLTAHGRLLVGIDSMLAAYTLVGRAWLVWPLRVRLLRPSLSYLYRAFARNRYRFSRLLGYAPPRQCEHGVCQMVNPFFRGRQG
jgi:predicted DCC family thiol-disulfide oxidoreductase YuxK